MASIFEFCRLVFLHFFFFFFKGVCHINGWSGTTRTIRELGRHKKDCQCSIFYKSCSYFDIRFPTTYSYYYSLKLNTSSSCTLPLSLLLSNVPCRPIPQPLVLITARLNAAIADGGDRIPPAALSNKNALSFMCKLCRRPYIRAHRLTLFPFFSATVLHHS